MDMDPRRVAVGLGAIAFSLILVSVGCQVIRYVFHREWIRPVIRLMDVSGEMNVPTFFSVGLLLLGVLLLVVLARLNRGSRDARYWNALSLVFLYMAYDEAFQVHERWMEPMRRFLGGSHLGIFYFAWVIPGLLLAVLLAFSFRRFLFRLPAKTRRGFLLAATLYLGGCIGMEMAGGAYFERHGYKNLPYNLISTGEESLEMIGLVIFIHALLSHLSAVHPDLRLRFAVAGGGAAGSGPRPAD